MQKVRDHLNQVYHKYQTTMEDQVSGTGLVKAVTLTEKLVKDNNSSVKNRKDALEWQVQKLQENNEKREGTVQINKVDLKKQDKEKIKYFNTKAKNRDNSVREIKSAIAEDIEQRKEIAKLRKMDRDEFMSRRNHYETLEKQKIWQSI